MEYVHFIYTYYIYSFLETNSLEDKDFYLDLKDDYSYCNASKSAYYWLIIDMYLSRFYLVNIYI